MADSSKATTTLKLVISKKTNKVIYAEAKKDFDFLFQILSFPVGSITKLFITKDTNTNNNNNMFGSLPNLYRTLGELNSSRDLVPELYDQTIRSLLKETTCTTTAASTLSGIPSLHFPSSTVVPQSYYKCCSCSYFACVNGTQCPRCASYTLRAPIAEIKVDGKNEGGYVRGATSYMVMDNLKVIPSHRVSGISLLKDSGILDLSSVEETVVSVGYDQGVSLLKASLQSQTVLTDVFLAGEKALKRQKKG